MCAKVTFAAIRNRPQIVIKKITRIHIESTWKELTGKATITLARNVAYFDKYNVKEVFQGGDPVQIELGYDGEYYQEFVGYVSKVAADIPIVIQCEDEMYKLKRIPVNYVTKGTTLDGFLKSICPGYTVNALENVKLGSIRLAKTTVAKALEKLEQDFALHSFMRGKTLVCGKYYADDAQVTPIDFDLEKTAVSNALNYRTKDSVIIQIKGTSILANGQKITCEFGIEGGDKLDLTYYNIKLKAELEHLVKQDYDKRIADGFDGSFTAFGSPTIRHGQKVKLTSSLYPDREGIYYVEGVTKDFSDDATYRQIIKLGDKAA